ncbi:MAG: zinc-dependent metalloprotease [Pseudomonadota bacterium]
MRPGLYLSFALLLSACSADAPPTEPAADAADSSIERMQGFVDLYWDETSGRLYIGIERFDEPFLYQSSLARGVGSNDLGLDRGQLGDTHVARFVRSGSRVLLMADNLDYRAGSDNPAEQQAVQESFARSVLWGFDVSDERDGQVLVDGTSFFVRDAHGMAARLAETEEGSYAADASRSMIYLPRTKAFPDNSEVEAIVTLTGEATGEHLPTVVPDPTAVSVHMHHSFVRLPDDNYEPLPFDPRAGVIGLTYGEGGFADYATPIGSELAQNYGIRHRLEKKDPGAELSEAVDPIVYYLDPGAPEPVRSALLDGARWWNQAFEAAGYRDAFRVEMLPQDADPLDVRYNMIQWVHRSTRGWSYGYSVIDPRTGEIIKGHVSLGSLRVRQDYMIAEGLLGPYDGDAVPDTMLDMSLARIRQLSAHEIGHTLGFEHNFAASTQDRSSVMDYPFPLIGFDPATGISLDNAYDDQIGSWDIRTVLYAYQDFPDGTDRDAARQAILAETIDAGFKYVADQDARRVGDAHPDGNLWDNGDDAIVELQHLLRVRDYALGRFSENNIRKGRPLASMEEVLVPIYLLHRFQIQAVGKLLGGVYFDYALRADGQETPAPVATARQRQALEALLGTLDPAVLRLPDSIVENIPPRPPGYPATRELFSGATGGVFDPLAPAAAAAELTLEVLLDPERAARMNRNGSPSFGELLERLMEVTWYADPGARDFPIKRQTSLLVLDRLLRLAVSAEVDPGVAAMALDTVMTLNGSLAESVSDNAERRAWVRLAQARIARVLSDPAAADALPEVKVPPGSPIGSGIDSTPRAYGLTR